MKHPNEATLALHAGGDLGPLDRWRTRRHLRRCGACRDGVAGFEALREIAPDLLETPEVHWGRLAAEMKANIRLGLAAGECVRPGAPPLRDTAVFAWARGAVAFASVAALLAAGFVLQRPSPRGETAGYNGVELRSTGNGIQVRGGLDSMRMIHAGSAPADVSYTAGAQASMSAGYVDSETHYVTVTTVYAN